jgi:hypothetical protein
MTSRPEAPARPHAPAARRERTSRLRRATQLVLGVGTVLALGSAFGPLWLVRVGLVVAVLAGVLACSLAWRELSAARRQHARAMLSATQEHGATLHEERTRNASVVDALTERVQSAGMVIAGQRVTIASLRGEVASLAGDKTRLVGELRARDGVITSLRETVSAQEAELASRPTEDDAEVHHLPRRADLAALDPQLIETAMVLPNYEGDRQVG